MNKNKISFASEVRESFRMAIGAIAAHKLRSSLTLLGVLVGVFSIIVVMTAMRVLQNNIEGQLSSLGNSTFMVRKWPSLIFNGSSAQWEKYMRRKNISYEQGKKLEARADLPLNIGMELAVWSGEIQTRYKKSAPDVRLFGETAGSFAARGWSLADGRLLFANDVESAHDLCVLGATLATNIFPNGSAVGERVKIDGINYTVVGVLEKKGGSLGGDQDNFAAIPLTTAMNRYGRHWASLNLLVQARDRASFDSTFEETRALMRNIRRVPPDGEDDFELISNDSLIQQFNSFTATVRIGVTVVSSIALVAAGIGIMNIMLVSVTERTREIGIRRAIGAKKRNIMVQFIMEAVALCELGGAAGVLLGILGGNATAFFLKLPPVVPLDWVIIGLVICSVVGIVFGTYPAWKAANLDPIESLRYE
jgi:putative ABC transport system permease protein